MTAPTPDTAEERARERETVGRLAAKFPDQRVSYSVGELNALLSAAEAGARRAALHEVEQLAISLSNKALGAQDEQRKRLRSSSNERTVAHHGGRASAATELRDVIRALASSPAAASPWREIASAPKDGTEVLLTNGKRLWLGWFVEKSIIYDRYSVWMISGGFEVHPTMWQPQPALPSPPASEVTK